MKLYLHPKCTTCKKAVSYLDKNGFPYEAIDITKNPPSYEELSRSNASTLKGMFNTSGMQYREEGIKEKLEDLTKEEALNLLASNGMLVKRPVLVLEDCVLQGFKEEAWEAALSTRV